VNLAKELDELDRDGALRETADAVARHDRASFLKVGALGAGALLAVPALASAAPSNKQDVDILNYALTLEYLEAAFYAEALSKGALSGRLLRFAQVAGAHEAAHVALLKKVLGSAAVAQPAFDFKNTTAAPATFQATAIALEDTGVAAYTGQAARVKQAAVLQAAAQIQAVEARHAAWIRRIAGQNPAPTALNRKANIAQVLAVVRSTGFVPGL
jgi:hypothetical protein